MFLINAATCGICLYLSNEMQNTVLGLIGTVNTAVFNSFKGLVIAFVFHFLADKNGYPIPDIYASLFAAVACFCFYRIASNKKI
jgi:ABC-type phosphate/phosphonate transport system permease subunit